MMPNRLYELIKIKNCLMSNMVSVSIFGSKAYVSAFSFLFVRPKVLKNLL